MTRNDSHGWGRRGQGDFPLHAANNRASERAKSRGMGAAGAAGLSGGGR